MKCSMSKLFRSFFIFVLILIIVFPATGFAAKTKKSSSADLKSNKNIQNTDMTKKYKKQMNNILEATQLFYSVRLNYSMKSGESKKTTFHFFPFFVTDFNLYTGDSSPHSPTANFT